MRRDAPNLAQRLPSVSNVAGRHDELTVTKGQKSLQPGSRRYSQRYVGNRGIQELEEPNAQVGYFFELTANENLVLLRYLQSALGERSISTVQQEEVKLALHVMRYPMSSATVSQTALRKSFDALRSLLFHIAPEQLVISLLTEIQRKQIPALEFKEKWVKIQKLILYPTELRKPTQDSLLKVLHEPYIIGQLLVLTPYQRVIIVNEVYKRLASSLTNTPFDVLQEEYWQLSNRVRGNIEDGLNGYVAIRQGIHHYFSPTDQNKDGADTPIDQLNDYYATFVHPDFPNVSSAHKTLVHPVMNQRLQFAKAYLEQRGTLPAATEGILEVWGASLRENRNRRGDLSPHTFGVSIDIDAARNPNLNPFPTLFSKLMNKDIAGKDFVSSLRSRKNRQVFARELGSDEHTKTWQEQEHEVRNNIDNLLKASMDIVQMFSNNEELREGIKRVTIQA